MTPTSGSWPINGRSDFPSKAEREQLDAALHATGAETGFWDDNGRPAPWPDDIDDWTLETPARAGVEGASSPPQPCPSDTLTR